MEKELKEVVKKMAEKAKEGNSAEAMHFTQAALNAVHALMTLKQIERV